MRLKTGEESFFRIFGLREWGAPVVWGPRKFLNMLDI